MSFMVPAPIPPMTRAVLLAVAEVAAVTAKATEANAVPQATPALRSAIRMENLPSEKEVMKSPERATSEA
jgi:hypothetical protein